VIVYSSAPLEQPLEVTGSVRVEVWITTDVPDTDLAVRLTDVYPDGRSMLVLDSIFRARYAHSPDFTASNCSRRASRCGSASTWADQPSVQRRTPRPVDITSSNAPRFAPNPNTGEMFLADGDSGQIAHTTILHDADHPSAIILPIH